MTNATVSAAPASASAGGVPLSETADAAALTYRQDPELALALSRFAALQGHAVGAYRFGMTAHTAEGVALKDLPRHVQAQELWSAHFPGASMKTIKPSELERGHFPLLWVSSADERVLLLRGQLSGGQCNAEDAHGQVSTPEVADLSQGHLLQLRPAASTTDEKHSPKTAGDWFVYAVRQYRTVFFDAIMATTVVSLVGLAGAMYSMQVYDRVLPTKGYSTLVVLTVGALLAVLLELILKQVRANMIDRACKAIDQDLSAVFFGKALDIRMDARPRTVGTFASQIRYFESVRTFLTSSTLFILADSPFALLFIGVIAMISGPVALVPLLILPLALLVGWLLRRPIEDLTAMNMAESNRKNGLLIEAIDGIESIKASNAEWKLLERWRQLTALIASGELQLKALTSLSTNVTQTVQQVIYIGMITVGAYEVTEGHLTMGGLIACTIISGRALGPLAQIPSLIVQWKQAEIALKGLDGIMALPNDRDSQQRLLVPESCRSHLRLDNVAFAYGQGQPILQTPAVTISPGERVGVIGSIGSGKTTFIKVLSGLYQPQQGTVFLDNLDVTHLAPEFVREHIGYLPQDVRLFQGTLRDNLTLGLPSPSDSQILRAAAMTGLYRVIQAHPKGMELEISEGGHGLSGGQRQLVGLTRMLLQQPTVMLLDEPTASMDAQLEERVMCHLFQEIAPDSTLVVVTHKPALLRHVQRLIVMEQGRIVLDGPRDEVLARLRAPQAVAPVVAVSSTASPESQA